MKCLPEVELERDALGVSADNPVQSWELGGAGSETWMQGNRGYNHSP